MSEIDKLHMINVLQWLALFALQVEIIMLRRRK